MMRYVYIESGRSQVLPMIIILNGSAELKGGVQVVIERKQTILGKMK